MREGERARPYSKTSNLASWPATHAPPHPAVVAGPTSISAILWYKEMQQPIAAACITCARFELAIRETAASFSLQFSPSFTLE